MSEPLQNPSAPSEDRAPAEKKKSPLAKRVTTGLPLILLVIVIVWNGGWLFAVVAFITIALSLYEELRALSFKGHHPVWWVSFAGLVIAIPLMMLYSTVTLVPLMTVLSFLSIFLVMRRQKPELMDIMTSLLPLFSIVLPGMCLFGILDTQPMPLQRMLLTLIFAIAVGCDTCAYAVGSLVGGPKLCPNISPKKTIAGAVGGLSGSVLLAWLTGAIFAATVPEATYFPPFWANMLAGLVGGVVAQVGDLFASLVKRHCGVKDFSDLLPGHGGALDRMDSILFCAVIVYSYRAILVTHLLP